jgi:hypothetical protein
MMLAAAALRYRKSLNSGWGFSEFREMWVSRRMCLRKILNRLVGKTGFEPAHRDTESPVKMMPRGRLTHSPLIGQQKSRYEAGFDMKQLVGETGFEPAPSDTRAPVK